MITARQSRAARALLGWTQETLADKARVSLTALKRLESDSGLEVYESTRDQVRRAVYPRRWRLHRPLGNTPAAPGHHHHSGRAVRCRECAGFPRPRFRRSE
ncbi:helix-turn-helix domain-containing protein [Acidomonas methanolica]